uniref:Androgenic hormone n=1 Tax=Porcellio dilatatus petiti TaxID=96811 RepID=H9NNE5_PORDI|nr:androgenic hormone [Porcellio dilatatus petiti]
MKGLLFIISLLFLTLHQRVWAYQVEGMKSDVICADIMFTVHCICNELGRFPTSRLTKPCPWPNRERRSTDDEDYLFEEDEDEEFFHPRALSRPTAAKYDDEILEDEVSFHSRTKRDIAFHEECCNIRTEHKCNRTTVELYCRRFSP